jgi:transcriptional regulator GlxA family with amidase domain
MPGTNNTSRIIPDHHLKKAQAAEQIIRADFEKWHSVEELAKLVGLKEAQLQAAFKAVYGLTVGVYSREMRLKHAHSILEKNDYPLRVVCEMVGYPDPGNFSYAFKKLFGYRPGEVIKNKNPLI